MHATSQLFHVPARATDGEVPARAAQAVRVAFVQLRVAALQQVHSRVLALIVDTPTADLSLMPHLLVEIIHTSARGGAGEWMQVVMVYEIALMIALVCVCVCVCVYVCVCVCVCPCFFPCVCAVAGGRQVTEIFV